MPVGLDRTKQVQRITLRIDEVDISSRSVHGYDKSNVLVVATWRETPNGVINVPAQNERWIAQREGMGQWRLVGRLDTADDQTWIEGNLAPGDMLLKANNIWFTGTLHGVGGGSGTVTSVTAGDASIVVGGTASAPTIETADLSTISTLHSTVGDVSMNSHKITNLTPGVLGTDAATVSQIPTTFVSSFNTRTGAVTLLKADVTGTGLSFSDIGALGATAAAGGDLAGNYPNPTIKADVALSGNPTATTQLAADNSTRIATTAFVKSQGYLTSAPVTSVFGRTGAVTAATGDYSLTQINKGTQHRLVISGASTLGDFPAGTSGQLLQSTGSTTDPAWTTSTYPTTAGAAGHVPRSDGTNYVDAQLAATDLSNGTVGLGHVVLDNGPALINPTATTQAAGDNSTKVANTAFVTAAITAAGPNIYTITQTAHGFSVGNVLKYTGTAYALAKADNADDAEVVGIVASVIDANDFTLQVAGEVTTLSGLTAGTTYFLSDTTAGLLTATAPTTNGSISKPLGVAVATTALFFFNFRGEVIQTNGSVSVTPSGAMMQYAGSTVPSGWLLCDGTSYPTATYPDLYNAIGYTYGGSGANFNVPDARGRILVGKDAGTFASLGGTGGAETVTLTATQIPGHTHSGTTGSNNANHSHTFPGATAAGGSASMYAPGGATLAANTSTSTQSSNHVHAFTTDNGTGGGGSHTNLQPYLVVNQIIKT